MTRANDSNDGVAEQSARHRTESLRGTFKTFLPEFEELKDDVRERLEPLGEVELTLHKTSIVDAEAADDELVSVVVPTFNCLEFLDECLTSIAEQSYRSLEILIADDGSTDGTIDRVFQLMNEWDSTVRVKFVALPHSGMPAVVRNFAMKNMASERSVWTTFMDSDDLFSDPGAIAALIEGVRGEPDAFAAYAAFETINEAGNRLSGPRMLRRSSSNRWRWRASHELTWHNVASGNLMPYHLQGLILKTGIAWIPYFYQAEDQGLYERLYRISATRAGEKVAGIVQVPRVVAQYRKREASISARENRPRKDSTPRGQLDQARKGTPASERFYEDAAVPAHFVSAQTKSLYAANFAVRRVLQELSSARSADALAIARRTLADSNVRRLDLITVVLRDIVFEPLCWKMLFRRLTPNRLVESRRQSQAG